MVMNHDIHAMVDDKAILKDGSERTWRSTITAKTNPPAFVGRATR
jgi:hypothetical protein